MPFLESIRLALSQLAAQKLKSLLTLLGIVISVTFLITVVSIIEGVNVFVRDTIANAMAANSFDIKTRAGIRFGEADVEERRRWRRRPELNESDIDPVATALPAGALWAAYVEGEGQIETIYEKPVWTRITAVSGDAFRIERTEIERGRAIAPQEVASGTPVAVIGFEVAERMFGKLDALDRELKIGGSPYRVVGVVAKQGSLFGESLDRAIYVPLTSPGRRSLHVWARRVDAIHGIRIHADDPVILEQAKETVRQTMRVRHQLRPADEDDFTIETSEAGLAEWNSIKTKLIAAAAILPTIGLIIGSLVIMNIMLVVVTERTREIGIRKALGARRWDILSQFLVESATLSTIGAGIGIAGGILAAKIIAQVSPLPAAVALWSIPAGLALGIIVGIIAGVYPASRASKLDPITALGYET